MKRGHVVALAGLAIVLLLSLPTYHVRGAALAPASEVVALLAAERPVTQQLAVETLGLSGFVIGAELPAASAPLTLTLRLRVADSSLPDLRTVSASVATLQRTEGLLFRFAPLPGRLEPYAITSSLELQLAAGSGAEAMPVRLLGGIGALAGQPPQGAGIEAGLTLSTQPLYQRRPLDLLWPITTMAAGRPGLLGWPPVYPLLAYGLLASLAYGVTVIVHMPRDDQN